MSEDPIRPLEHDVFLFSDDSDTYTLMVRLAKSAVTYGPVDILFLFDATASMQNVIQQVASEAMSIMRAIRQANPETNFAVASFADYNSSDPVWDLHQDVTSSLELASSALERIRLRHGEDWPEAYGRALFESRFIGWRRSAQHYMVLFGDAPAHDPTFYGIDFGVDPGRDRLAGTADDLTFERVVRQLADDKITVITIYDRGDPSDPKPLVEETLKGFRYLADTTGGVSKKIGSVGEVAEAIRSALVELPRPTPKVEVEPDYDKWVTVTVTPEEKSGGDAHSFRVSVRPPPDAPAGVYRIPLRVSAGDGPQAAKIGESLLIVRLGWLAYPWFWPVLIAVLFLTLLCAILALRLRERAPALHGTYQVGKLFGRLALFLLLAGLPILVILYLPETPGEFLALINSQVRL